MITLLHPLGTEMCESMVGFRRGYQFQAIRCMADMGTEWDTPTCLASSTMPEHSTRCDMQQKKVPIPRIAKYIGNAGASASKSTHGSGIRQRRSNMRIGARMLGIAYNLWAHTRGRTPQTHPEMGGTQSDGARRTAVMYDQLGRMAPSAGGRRSSDWKRIIPALGRQRPTPFFGPRRASNREHA